MLMRHSPEQESTFERSLLVTLLWALRARRWRRGSTTREVDGSYGEPETTRGSLVLRWTSKLGCCLTRQSKRSCSEAVKEKAISDKPSTGSRTRGSTKEQP